MRELPLEGARTPLEALLELPRTADSTTRLTVRLTPDPLLEDSRPDGATCIRLDPRDLVDESSEEPDEPRTDEPVLLDPPPERLGALVPELPDDRSTALLRVFPSVLPPLCERVRVLLSPDEDERPTVPEDDGPLLPSGVRRVVVPEDPSRADCRSPVGAVRVP